MQRSIGWLVLGLMIGGCGSQDEAPPGQALPDAGGEASGGAGGASGAGGTAGTPLDAGSEETGPPQCGTAGQILPDGLIELAWDDDSADSNLREQSFSIDVDGKTYLLAEEPLHEAVRFELPHPARIHGFSVRWANTSASDATTELAAGLYPDFGYNGFDFWEPDPLWTGTRCAGDVKDGQWLVYAFDEPIMLEHPGLVYVAHRADAADAAVFAYDSSEAADCAPFDACRSSLNLPEAPGYYNGISFPFQRDFLVRLHVEYTEELKDEQRIFQPAPGPEGKHASWGDYDDDGWDDVFVQGKLWHNEQGTLVDRSSGSGLEAIPATGGVWGDYDNDGCLDLFVFVESGTDADSLMRGACDGTFTDVTAAAGIVDSQSYEDCGNPANIRSPTAAAAWLDVDADGWLDLYLANFICWETGSYYTDTVFRNDGDGTFTERTAKDGWSDWKVPSRGAAPADADGDGDVDLFVNTYRLEQNVYFENQGDGTVVEKALDKGVAGVPSPAGIAIYYGHTIGAAWGDLDGDADLDLVAANLAHPRFFELSDKTQILINGGAKFTDLAGGWATPFGSPAGLRYQETHSVPVLADFDRDGALDLVITCVYDGRPTDFYWGNGDGSFRLDAYHAGITTEDGWGAAVADLDNDGDLDLMATSLFVNTLAAADQGHFLQVRVRGGPTANRAAIGAMVKVEAAGKSFVRHVQGGSGKGGQDSQTLHFGLGAATSVSKITVVYPGNLKVEHAGPFAVDRRIWVAEDGTTHEGWGPP